ncbi:MAG: 2,3-bisphosphoglycerate-independent phosphoglycerate mutase [Desulfarculales bacterium]|jgi:2,3-bisphosphoglycerate-independent phosphoglycerate mutase|nr:2,3-bisphosphoglycerate-independent phosphoglycerate mutase [Desulfarculales bacterium]
MKTKPALCLVILDGWGIAPSGPGNAVTLAHTPYMDRLFLANTHNRLYCYGKYVGLPEGQMGNSEVGHLNLGAGRIIYQDITSINMAIEDGSFQRNPAFVTAIDRVKNTGATLHLMGLIGPGGVHALSAHLYALIDMAVKGGVAKIAVHAFLDGRDTAPDSGLGYLKELLAYIAPYEQVSLASLSGRYYAMDRDNRWERVKEAWLALVQGEGIAVSEPVQALRDAYAAKEFDEFIRPRVIRDDKGAPVAPISDNDAVIFYNFRSDRARELTRAFTDPDFSGFDAGKRPRLSYFVTMTEYDEHLPVAVAFPPQRVVNTLADVLSANGLSQLHMAETEKYAHVTFFFNGGKEEPVPGEDRVLIPSPKDVSTYDQKPAMSAPQITDTLLQRIAESRYDFILVNYANCDMVGHTGVLEAAVKAVETLDECLSRLIPAVLQQGGYVLLTSDHGNAEQMLDQHGAPFTSHTIRNQVPVLLAAPEGSAIIQLREGSLCDIAPTVLALMNLAKPAEMTGKSLLE